MSKKRILILIAIIYQSLNLLYSQNNHNLQKDSYAYDIDGNMYDLVKIGNQIWFGENLKVTRYNDGEAINIITNDTLWSNDMIPAMCWHNNDSNLADKYGGYYNWYVVSSGKLCPSGWHVPGRNEWDTLIEFLGGAANNSGKLKAHDDWKKFMDIEISNEYKFSGIPAGNRYLNGKFVNTSLKAYWWSSTALGVKIVDLSAERAWGFSLEYGTNHILSHYHEKGNGFSIRCIKDNED